MHKIFGSKDNYHQVRDLVSSTPYSKEAGPLPKPTLSEAPAKTSPFNYGQFAQQKLLNEAAKEGRPPKSPSQAANGPMQHFDQVEKAIIDLHAVKNSYFEGKQDFQHQIEQANTTMQGF